MKKILFISNSASRTGAPLVLLCFLQWLRKEGKDIAVDVVFLKGGDLMKDFIEISQNCYDLNSIKINRPFIYKVYSYVLKKMNINNGEILNRIAKNDYDIIYANTIVAIPVASKLKFLSENNPRLIAHIHELNTVINECLPTFKEFIPQVNQFISVSKLVMQNLNDNWGINPQANQLLYPFSNRKILNENKNNDCFEVGASGLVHWRKGDDLFIQVANYIKTRYPDMKFKFTWVGHIEKWQQNIIEADLEKANLNEVVFFVGEQSNPENYFKNFDVFLLTSREDPFPLVCIEVGKAGIPIICFENATGTAEILKNGGGFVVPYIDTVSMAEKLILYYNDLALRKRDGELNKFNFSKFTIEILGKKLYNLIDSI